MSSIFEYLDNPPSPIEESVPEFTALEILIIFFILFVHSLEYKFSFNVAFISNEIQHYLPQEMGIFLETSENFGKEYSEKEHFELSNNLDEMMRYFAETFCDHIDEYDAFLRKNIEMIKMAEKSTFSSDRFCTTYAVLLSVYALWKRIFHVDTNLDFEKHLKKTLLDSQDFEGGKTFSVIDSFSKLLNNFVTEGKFQVVKLDREMKYERGSDTIIVDGDLMLMEERILKDYFLPEIAEAQTVNCILNPLAKHEYLVATNGHKKPTTVYDSDGMAVHINLVAVRYCDLVTSETIKRIDSLSSSQTEQMNPISYRLFKMPLVNMLDKC